MGNKQISGDNCTNIQGENVNFTVNNGLSSLQLKELISELKKDNVSRERYEQILLENKRLTDTIKEIQIGEVEQNTDFEKIHKFLDVLNEIYDNKFKDFKKYFYGDCWKFGLAYTSFSKRNLSFTCFPIKHNSNQKQILNIDKSIMHEFLNKGLTVHSRDNSIQKEEYKDLCKELITYDLEKCFNNKLFNVPNEFQAVEILFHLIKEMKECLGLEEKDEYTFQEIYEGWFQYLPIWIDEVLKIKTVRVYKDGSINPSFLLCQLDDKNREDIDKKVKSRIKNREIKTNSFTITHSTIKLMLVIKSLEYLQRRNIQKIKRPYPKPIYPKDKKSYWVWEAYPIEVLRGKLNKIYENLANTYNGLIKDHFEQLYDELNFFNEFDKIILHINTNNPNARGEPRYKFYYLKSQGDKPDNYYELYFNDEFPYEEESFKRDYQKEGPTIVQLEEGKFNMIMTVVGGSDFVYKDSPVLELCYQLLEEAFKKYFDSF